MNTRIFSIILMLFCFIVTISIASADSIPEEGSTIGTFKEYICGDSCQLVITDEQGKEQVFLGNFNGDESYLSGAAKGKKVSVSWREVDGNPVILGVSMAENVAPATSEQTKPQSAEKVQVKAETESDSKVAAPVSSKENKSSMSGSTLLILIFLFIAAVITTYIIGAKMQASGALNIFVDYTDALFSFLSLIVPSIMSLILCFVSDPSIYKTTIMLTVLATLALLFFPAKSAFIYNRTPGMAIFSLAIKYLTSFLYIFGIVFIVGSGIGTSSKRSDETESEFRRRIAANKTSGILMALHHLFMAWIVHKTTRIQEFRTETLNFSFTNRFDQLMLAAAEADNEG